MSPESVYGGLKTVVSESKSTAPGSRRNIVYSKFSQDTLTSQSSVTASSRGDVFRKIEDAGSLYP